MRRILPIIIALLGLGGGAGAGLFLRPAPDPGGQPPAAEHEAEPAGEEGAGHVEGGPEYVKMNNQFVVPVVENGRVAAMVVLSLSVEIEAGNTEAVYQREPKLRDAFLQVLFDHANVGGFGGSFTDGTNLLTLRTSLKEAGGLILGPAIRDVLITDIARQDS